MCLVCNPTCSLGCYPSDNPSPLPTHPHPPTKHPDLTNTPYPHPTTYSWGERSLLCACCHFFPLWKLKEGMRKRELIPLVWSLQWEEDEEWKKRRKGGEVFGLFIPSLKSCRCHGEIRPWQLCVYVRRLDDIWSHMHTQFAVNQPPALQDGTQFLTHRLFNPQCLPTVLYCCFHCLYLTHTAY